MLLFSKIYEFYCLYGIEILLSGATGAARRCPALRVLPGTARRFPALRVLPGTARRFPASCEEARQNSYEGLHIFSYEELHMKSFIYG